MTDGLYGGMTRDELAALLDEGANALRQAGMLNAQLAGQLQSVTAVARSNKRVSAGYAQELEAANLAADAIADRISKLLHQVSDHLDTGRALGARDLLKVVCDTLTDLVPPTDCTTQYVAARYADQRIYQHRGCGLPRPLNDDVLFDGQATCALCGPVADPNDWVPLLSRRPRTTTGDDPR